MRITQAQSVPFAVSAHSSRRFLFSLAEILRDLTTRYGAKWQKKLGKDVSETLRDGVKRWERHMNEVLTG